MTALSATAPVSALVPGDPDAVDALARQLERFAHGAGQAAGELRGAEAGDWVGPAADAFRSKLGELPRRLETAAEAFAEAARALRSFADVLRDARVQAARAVDLYATGAAQTTSWQAAGATFDRVVRDAQDAARAQGAPYREPVGRPATSDPGEAERARAEQLLAGARDDVAEAGRLAAARLHAAAGSAPDEPSLLDRALHHAGEFVAGAGEATWGLLELGVKLSPAYALIDPEGYVEHARGLGQGLVYGVQNPREFAEAVVDWETWQESPARALGHLVPDLVLAVTTAGAGNAATASGRAATAGRRLAAEARNAAALGQPSRNAARLADEVGDVRELAERFQGSGAYPGVDPDWRAGRSTPGQRIWVATPFEGQFAVPDSVARHTGTDAQRYMEGVQVKPRDGDSGPTYRAGLQAYDVQRAFPQAEGTAVANRQFGAGGLPQIMLPALPKELVELGLLRPGPRVDFDDVAARIPERGVVDPPPIPGPGYTPPPPWTWDVPAGAAATGGTVAGATADRLSTRAQEQP